ncbi:MAG: hypothetical protein NT094_03610 [Candidatus Staskawiczbacteria bacterium]|nr:hypothetical protein [Candidatus Staskawiczbacteria bacterium]
MEKQYTCMFGMDGIGDYKPCPHLGECNLNGMNQSPLNKYLDIKMNNPLKFKEEMEKFLEGIDEKTYLNWYKDRYSDLTFYKCFYKNKENKK